jgi:ribonucleoside-diphosphate reductase subunit M2
LPENIISQFSLDVQLAEARAFYSFQSMIEQVHSETYSLLIETYVRDQEEKNFLFRGMETSELLSAHQREDTADPPVPCVRKKADWALKYITPELVSLPYQTVCYKAD